MRTLGDEDDSRLSSDGAIDAAPALPGRVVGPTVAGGNIDGGRTGADAPDDDEPDAGGIVGKPDPADEPPRPTPSELFDPPAADPADEAPAPLAPVPREPPAPSFMPRMLGGKAPADGAGRFGKVPTEGIVGPGVVPSEEPDDRPPAPGEIDEEPEVPSPAPSELPAPDAEESELPSPAPTPAEAPWLPDAFEPEVVPGEAPTPAPLAPEGAAPTWPTRGAVAAEGDAAGRAAGGVPPLSSEEDDAFPPRADPAEVPVPVELAEAEGGAAATREPPMPLVPEDAGGVVAEAGSVESPAG